MINILKLNRTFSFNHELNVILNFYRKFYWIKITNEQTVFNSTEMYEWLCYMPTITIKYKFERNTSPEHTRNETVIIKKTITQWGVAIAHPDTIYIEIIPNLICIDRTVMI